MEFLSLLILEVARFLAGVGVSGLYAPLLALIVVYLLTTAVIIIPLMLFILRRRSRRGSNTSPSSLSES